MNNLLAIETRNAISATWPMPVAVLVDLNSLLTDSVADLSRAINELFASEKLPLIEEVHVRNIVGRGIRALVRRAYLAQGVALDVASLDCRVEAMVETYARHLTGNTALRPGARETLDYWLEKGVQLALVSDEFEDTVSTVLAHVGLRDSFAVTVCQSYRQAACGSRTDLMPAALDKLGIAPEDAVVVADSSTDAGVAQSAWIRSVRVPFGQFAGLDAVDMAPAVAALFSER